MDRTPNIPMGKFSSIFAIILLLFSLNLFGGPQRAEGLITEERGCPHDLLQLYIPAGGLPTRQTGHTVLRLV